MINELPINLKELKLDSLPENLKVLWFVAYHLCGYIREDFANLPMGIERIFYGQVFTSVEELLLNV